MMGHYIYTILFCCLTFLSFGQQTAEERISTAKDFLANSKYAEALAILNSSFELSRTNQEAQLMIAVCQYQLNDLDKAEQMLQRMLQEEESDFPESLLYLGKVYHARNEFAQAAKYYKLYLKNIKSDHPNRRIVWGLIKNTSFGLARLYAEPAGVVENMGPNINTEYDEFAPITSPNRADRLYFSSIRKGNLGGKRNKYGVADDRYGHYTSDMYSCKNENGVWKDPKGMHFLLNSPQHEVLFDIKSDGSVLYYFKGTKLYEGQVLVDTFRRLEERSLSSDPLPAPFDSNQGDRTPFFVSDTLLYFASNRPGGYGGYDIYKLAYYNGRWSAPINLGPVVNSPFDELAPFLALNGKTLYYSSNNPSWSMGGFDVLKVQYNDKKFSWTYPYNPGIPLNSAGDDTHFRLAKDGYTGFLCSTRKEGFGQRDLYVIHFNDFLPEQEVAYTAPPIQPEREPIADRIEPEEPPVSIPDPPTPVLPDPVIPTSAIPALVFDTPEDIFGGENQVQLDEVLDLMKKYQGRVLLLITAYAGGNLPTGEKLFEAVLGAEAAKDYFASNGIASADMYVNGVESAAGTDYIKSVEGLNRVQFRFVRLSGDLPVEIQNINLSDGFGGPLSGTLFYKVQIASLTGPFKKGLMGDYADPMVEKHPTKDFYRYSIGQFNTYSEVKNFKKELKSAGIDRALIIPYIKGVRLSAKEAQELKVAFPDLQNYLLNN